MGEMFGYAIKCGLLMLGLYFGYIVFLAKEKQPSFNRAVILAIYAISFGLLPLMYLIGGSMATNDSMPTVGLTIDLTPVAKPGCVEKPVWPIVLIWIYVAGLAVMSFDSIFTGIKIWQMISRCERKPLGKFVLVITERADVSPFSWMHYMVVSRKDFEKKGKLIITHELQHLRRHHWIDLAIAQFAVIVEWFNPAAWLLRNELMNVHEYQADNGVLDSGIDIFEYQQLLIKKAVGARFQSLTNSLNHSKLKKRFTMMYKDPPSRGRRFRALALVPALALALAATSIPQVSAAVSSISNSSLSTDKGTKNPSDVQEPSASLNEMALGSENSIPSVNESLKGESEEQSRDVIPQYPGGQEAMLKAVMEKLSFPDPERKWKEGASGKAVIGFSVYPDGTIGDYKIIKSSGYADLDECAIQAVKEGLTVKWTPGTSNGKPVTVTYALPVQFKQK